MPGVAAGAELTPEGSLHTGFAELGFHAGPRLAPYDGSHRRVADARVPEFTSGAQLGGVHYSVTTFAGRGGGRAVAVVRVEMRNRSRRPRVARWATVARHTGGAPGRYSWTLRFPRPARPGRPGLYFQPGARFDPGSRYRFARGAFIRDDRVLYLVPKPPTGGERRLRVRVPSAPGTQPETHGRGQARYSVRLAPGETTRLDFVMPIVPPRARAATLARLRRLDPERVQRRTRREWRSTLARGLRLELPERPVQDAFHASLVNVLAPRYRSRAHWVQPVNKLHYHAFWLRDAAVMTNALDLVGLHRQARENLAFFSTWQRRDGLFISREGQLDGIGQSVWAIGQHARRTRDRRFAARVLPRVARAVDWIETATRSDQHGLLPSTAPGDNEGSSGHIVGDNFWAAAGLREAVQVARLARSRGDAGRFESVRAVFERNLRAALAATVSRTGGAIPPILEGGGEDWGNLWASYPARILPAGHPAVGATLRAVRRKFREGLATYAGGNIIHGYLGFRVFQTELARGERGRAIRGLYDTLAHMTPTWGGFEFAHGRALTWEFDNLTPHGWFAAEYVALVRNMLVSENGRGLVLGGAIPPSWLLPGKTTAVHDAPTTAGKVSWRLRAGRGGGVLTWRARVPRGTPLRFRSPDAAGRLVDLPTRSGRGRLRWRSPRNPVTYSSARRALRRLVEPAPAP